MARTPKTSSDSSDVSTVPAVKRVISPVPNSFVEKMRELLPPDMVKTDLKVIAEAFVKTLVNEASTGNSVTFTNLFTFKRAHRDARTHKNPRDSTPIDKPAHYVLTMEVKAQLKKEFASIPVVKTSTDVVETVEVDSDAVVEAEVDAVAEVASGSVVEVAEAVDTDVDGVKQDVVVDSETDVKVKKSRKSKTVVTDQK